MAVIGTLQHLAAMVAIGLVLALAFFSLEINGVPIDQNRCNDCKWSWLTGHPHKTDAEAAQACHTSCF